MWIAIYLVPLPAAAYLIALLAGQEDFPLRARFELSEAALYDEVKEQHQGSHRAGLFQITLVSNVEECTFLETGGDSLDQGFAYCPKERPSGTRSGSPPEIEMRPVNGDWQHSDWWTYKFVDGSY
jgi:hypothetical protein